jgi:hypothetical protein
MAKRRRLLDPAERGRKGGKRRLVTMSDEQRRESARKAALARHARTPKAERKRAARSLVLIRWARYRARKAEGKT